MSSFAVHKNIFCYNNKKIYQYYWLVTMANNFVDVKIQKLADRKYKSKHFNDDKNKRNVMKFVTGI